MSADGTQELRRVRVASIRDVAVDIRAFDLVADDGRALPTYSAGAHIDVHVPNGLVRQYSLCGDVETRSRYTIAVKRESGGRGGSIGMHDDVEVDTVLAIGGPRNYFELAPQAVRSVLVAGGIGITPIHAMAQSLAAHGRDWTLHYCARSEAHAAFYRDLQVVGGERVIAHFSEVPMLDVAALFAVPVADTHVYCCGPVGLMSAVKDATRHWEPAHVHFEWFSAPPIDRAHDHPFEVELARSGRVLAVPTDRTILETVREAGIDVPSSCEEGVCGTCETALLAGDADHRDLLLTPEERACNRSLMICVSRARSKRLVLDL